MYTGDQRDMVRELKALLERLTQAEQLQEEEEVSTLQK